MKSVLLSFLAAAIVSCVFAQDEMKCNFKTCGTELLNFDHFSIGGVFRKLEISSFCVKNCTPPVLHEFFQSLIFAVTKRIPGHCEGHECAEKNRFIALTECAEKRAWPLLQCSKRLIDLAQVSLLEHSVHQKRNYTCSIVAETTQCLEEKLQECGPHAFSLVKEIFVDVVKMGIRAYCHASYMKEPQKEDEHATTPLAPYMERMKYFTDIAPVSGPQPYPQFVKGYRDGNAAAITSSVLLTLSLSVASMLWMMHR